VSKFSFVRQGDEWFHMKKRKKEKSEKWIGVESESG